MLLYRLLEPFGISLIECNTDGLIVKCDKKKISSIRKTVSDLATKLNLSCDVDEVRKIVHFDEQNYIMEFNNGKIKHLGVFGAFQENPFYVTGIRAVDAALREYYLNDIPVGITLRNIRNTGQLDAFQIIKKQKSNQTHSQSVKHSNPFILDSEQSSDTTL